MADDALYDLLSDLAACLQVELENDGAPVCWVGVAPGDGVVLDNAGCRGGKCGQAWTRLGVSYPASQVGVQDISPNNCAQPLGLDAEMGVMRCFSISDKTGGPKDLVSVAKRQMSDLLAMRRAVICCGSKEIIMGSYQPGGLLGGMAGGTWLLHIGTML